MKQFIKKIFYTFPILRGLKNEIELLEERLLDKKNEVREVESENKMLKGQILHIESENETLKSKLLNSEVKKKILRDRVKQISSDNEALQEEKLNLFLRDTLEVGLRSYVTSTNDPVRYGAVYLAIQDLHENGIEGSFAELGVWQGYTSRILRKFAPDRKLYLFDTFEGFTHEDLSESVSCDAKIKEMFKDTSAESVVEQFDLTDNVIIKKGFFPDSASSLEPDEKFAFVMIDFDLYKPIKEGLEFFYDKVVEGGYIFVHDYNLPFFEWGGKKAVDEFFSKKNVNFIQLPDAYGSVVIKK